MQAQELEDCNNDVFKTCRKRHRIEKHIEKLGKDRFAAICMFDKAQEERNDCQEQLLKLEQEYDTTCKTYISPISGT